MFLGLDVHYCMAKAVLGFFSTKVSIFYLYMRITVIVTAAIALLTTLIQAASPHGSFLIVSDLQSDGSLSPIPPEERQPVFDIISHECNRAMNEMKHRLKDTATQPKELLIQLFEQIVNTSLDRINNNDEDGPFLRTCAGLDLDALGHNLAESMNEMVNYNRNLFSEEDLRILSRTGNALINDKFGDNIKRKIIPPLGHFMLRLPQKSV